VKTYLISGLVLFAVGCAAQGDVDEESAQGQEALHREAAHGVVFENASDELAPFSRAASGEGLGGVAMLDYDGDGDLDVYLTNGVFALNGLFENNGDGTFTDVTLDAGVGNGYGNSGVVAGDLDNDGDVDLILTGEGHLVGPQQTPTRVYRNEGNGTFADVTATAGVPGAGTAMAAALGDINGDGLLDVFIASPGHIPFLTGEGTGESHSNKLYLNDGNMQFTDITDSAGVGGLYDVPGVGTLSDGACVAGFTDYDMDGDADILVGNCNAYPYFPFPMPVRPTPFSLYRNNGDNTFDDVAQEAGLGQLGFWMGLAFGDVDNDGDEDFFATSTGSFAGGQFPHALMLNNGDGTYSSVAEDSLGLSEFGWGTTMADFDNDGDLDLFEVGSLPMFGAIGAAGNPGRLYYNDGDGNFTDSSADLGINLSSDKTSGAAQGDYDGDGFADLLVMTSPWAAGGTGNPNGAPVLLRNGGNSNHAITVRLVGTDSNSAGVGARVRVKKGRLTQIREVRAGSSMASTDSPWPSFGIGVHTDADVKVTWPSGLVEEFSDVSADELVTLTEGTGDAD